MEEQLSKRELEVVQLVAEGKTSKEIAGSLELSIHTINSYLRTVYDKLQINSRMKLILWFKKNLTS